MLTTPLAVLTAALDLLRSHTSLCQFDLVEIYGTEVTFHSPAEAFDAAFAGRTCRVVLGADNKPRKLLLLVADAALGGGVTVFVEGPATGIVFQEGGPARIDLPPVRVASLPPRSPAAAGESAS